MATYKVFVSHSWSHDDDMNNLTKLLNSRLYYNFEYTEFRKHNPIESIHDPYVKRTIRENIQNSNVFLAIAGIYATYSEWMEYEMQIAQDYGFKIIGIKPFGNIYISSKVQSYAHEIVNWNTESIIAAIVRNKK